MTMLASSSTSILEAPYSGVLLVLSVSEEWVYCRLFKTIFPLYSRTLSIVTINLLFAKIQLFIKNDAYCKTFIMLSEIKKKKLIKCPIKSTSII